MAVREFLSRVARMFGRQEQRTISSLPWGVGGALGSGVVSAEQALTLIPFFACVRLIGDQMASLPLQTFRRSGDSRIRVADPTLVTSPSGVVSRMQWVQQYVVSLATRGNAYGLIIARDGMEIPTQVEWLHPDEVHIDETAVLAPRYFWRGRPLPREEIIHVPWMTFPGSTVGVSPVTAFARSIGVGLAATNYGKMWFDNGGQPPGTFKNSVKTLNANEAEIVTDRLTNKIRSGAPLVYGSDWDYTSLSATPEESQFLQTININATQMATIFGVPPEMVGGQVGGPLTYSSPDMNGLHLLKFTLRPWLSRFEEAISTQLASPRYVRFNVDAVVRADIKTRYEAHQMALSNGWLSVDEVRALEDLPPLPGGEGATYKTSAPQELPAPASQSTAD